MILLYRFRTSAPVLFDCQFDAGGAEARPQLPGAAAGHLRLLRPPQRGRGVPQEKGGSSQRVKTLEGQLRQAEEREGQLNNDWAPVEAAREQSLRKIYENLIGQNTLYQKLDQQMPQPHRAYDQKSQVSVNETYDHVLSEQRLFHAKK